MSSRLIAELTGKRHGHVIRDIDNMMAQLGDDPDLGHLEEVTDSRGYRTEIKLNRYYTELLITGYDVRRRAAVIDRWFELEKQVAQPKVPQSFAEALRLAADTQEQREQTEQEKQVAQPQVPHLQPEWPRRHRHGHPRRRLRRRAVVRGS